MHHWAGACFVFHLFCSIIRNQDFKELPSCLINQASLLHINSPTSHTIIPNHIRCHRHSRCLISVPIAHTDNHFSFFFYTQKKHLFLYHTHHRNPSRYVIAFAHKWSHSFSWTLFSFARACHPASHARRLIGTSWEVRYFQSHLHSPHSRFNKQLFLILAPLWVAKYLPSMIILTLLLEHLKCCLISAWRSLNNTFTFLLFKLILVWQTEIKTSPSWILKVQVLKWFPPSKRFPVVFLLPLLLARQR